MVSTKSEVAASGNVSNQQALVKRMLSTSLPKATKTIIPGGKHLLDEISQAKLESAVFTWLRRHRWFEWVRISFARNPGDLQIEEKKIMDFDQLNGYAVWELPARGKRWLAERMADTLISQKLIYIEAKKDGLYVATERGESDFGPDSENWEPYVEMLPVRRGEYRINQ